jgi:hypothetical protein
LPVLYQCFFIDRAKFPDSLFPVTGHRLFILCIVSSVLSKSDYVLRSFF